MTPEPPAGGSQSFDPEPTSRRAPGGGGHSSAQRAEQRRRRIRWVANFLIIGASLALVGIVLYFVITWQMAAASQSALRDELAAENPELAGAVQNVSESDFVTIGSLLQDARDAAEAERQAKLAELKAAADEYSKTVLGRVGKAMGDLVIPNIGVETVMVQGDFQGRSERFLRKGPGHWPESPLPGQGGSVVVSGHRSTYGAPFRKINELQPGDEFELTMPYAIFRYTVTQVIVVAPDEVEVVADQGREVISLVACHPLYSARQRIIAQADMTSFVLLETGL